MVDKGISADPRKQRRKLRQLVDGRWVAPLPDERHGSVSTYNNHSCRCQRCTVASRECGEVSDGRAIRVQSLPDCDICRDTPALYDSRLPGWGGGWGYVCERCFSWYGPGRTGVGHARRLIKSE